MSSRVSTEPYRILHCLRAPVGGLFRHVYDLVHAQNEAGHAVGVLCADEPNDPQTCQRVSDLEKVCALGVSRIRLGRLPGLSDARALLATSYKVRELSPNVLHGHGAKGGLLSRYAASAIPMARIYTPHGGSIHYAPNSLSGRVFGLAERLMLKRTDGLILESKFARSVFAERFGPLPHNTQIVHNGLARAEFDPIPMIDQPADFLFLGEIRELKGVFTLLDAISGIASKREIKVDVAGDGPDMDAFRIRVDDLSLTGCVNILGKVPAREAFARARAVLMPSHHDSFPYVALEAAAAGKPLIATSTGGIPEIFGADADRLVEPANVAALQRAMEDFLAHEAQYTQAAEGLRSHVESHFSLGVMATGVADVYAAALAAKHSNAMSQSDVSPHSTLDAAE